MKRILLLITKQKLKPNYKNGRIKKRGAESKRERPRWGESEYLSVDDDPAIVFGFVVGYILNGVEIGESWHVCEL